MCSSRIYTVTGNVEISNIIDHFTFLQRKAGQIKHSTGRGVV